MTPETEPTLSARVIRDLRAATAFLTRLPVGAPEGDLATACWAFPVAGLVVGGIAGSLLGVAWTFGAPPLVAALLALAAMAALTGALHEDGLADAADGLGGDTPERRLEIMRDSRIGAFGVLALVFSVALRAASLAALAGPGAAFAALFAAAALSRGLLPAMMAALPLASPAGLAAAVGKPNRNVAGLAAAIGAVAAIVFLGPAVGLGALALGVVAVAAIAALARRAIGGYNGDTLGAAQQVAETAILIGVSTTV